MSQPSTKQFLRVESTGDGVLMVEIDNPPANALVPELYDALSRLATELDRDSTVRTVVFASANPRIFVAGSDLKRMADSGFDRASVLERVDRAHAAFMRIQRISKPTIAAIEGHAMGGGCELALAMDFRFMARGRPRIGLPEVSLGLIPAAGGTQRLPWLIGRARAARMIMLAERLDADEAERIGLVTAACDDARSAALQMARRLTEMPSHALAAAKECLDEGFGGNLLRGLARERGVAAATFSLPEARAGVESFLARQAARHASTSPP
jgi:enoyl-CoA hydratase